jgi:hypothetical protein
MKLFDLINEEEIDSIEDKIEKKKVRTIYKSLKKGIVTEYNHYELPDKYRFIGKNELISSLHYDTNNDTLFIMVDDGDSKNIKFFFKSSVNDIMEPFEPPNRAWYINRLNYINKRFIHFNIKIFYPYSDDMLKIWNDLSTTPTTTGTSDTQN